MISKRWILSAALLAGCSSGPMKESATPADGTSPQPLKSHEAVVEAYSDGDSEYSGFYNNFEYKATILNSRVRDSVLARQTEYYQWDREKALAEREKFDKEKTAQTDVFLSFFTPDRKNDNLTDTKSIWRVYIEANGQRYQGKVKKVRSLLAELQVLYPYHNRWATSYLVTFPVPTASIESKSASMTITGPLGTRSIHFKPL